MKLRYTDCNKFYQYGFGENRHYTIVQIIPVNHKMVAVHETYSEDIVCLALIEFDTGVREIVPVQCGTDGLFMISNTFKGYVGIDFK